MKIYVFFLLLFLIGCSSKQNKFEKDLKNSDKTFLNYCSSSPEIKKEMEESFRTRDVYKPMFERWIRENKNNKDIEVEFLEQKQYDYTKRCCFDKYIKHLYNNIYVLPYK